jgi:hypothetical protein
MYATWGIALLQQERQEDGARGTKGQYTVMLNRCGPHTLLMLALVDTAHAMEKDAAAVRRANGAAAVEAETPREKTFAVT